jgi:hypothetical protein
MRRRIWNSSLRACTTWPWAPFPKMPGRVTSSAPQNTRRSPSTGTGSFTVGRGFSITTASRGRFSRMYK